MIGKELGRYLIVEALGEGGMAAVYKGYDRRLNRDVAIKVILKGYQQRDVFTKRFEREAKSVAQLTHPNIVSVIDYGTYEGIPYLVMEYIPGGTLKDQMGEPIPWGLAARMLVPIARALSHAHHEKLIHRDIKPANILVTKSGDMMLSDFGIAKTLDAEHLTKLTGTGLGIGTPAYMAPEQGMGKPVDYRVDIYSLGVVFYEMVTGRPPYEADTPMAVMMKHVMDPLPRPRTFVPDLPEEVERLIFRALAKEPDERFQSMEELARAFEEIIHLKETGISRLEKTPSAPPVIEKTPLISTPVESHPSQVPVKMPRQDESLSNKILKFIWIPVVLAGICIIAVVVVSVPRLLDMIPTDVSILPSETISAPTVTIAIPPGDSDETPLPTISQTEIFQPTEELDEAVPPTETPHPTPTETKQPTETPVPTVTPEPIRGLIAFHSNRSGNNDIYVMLPDGSDVRQLTFSLYDDRAAAWSPDGREIAYQSNSDGDYEIFVIGVDGGNIRQVTSNDCDDYSPVWSPNGRQFVFYSDCDGNREIYTISINGSNRTQLTHTTNMYNWFPSWSTDGSKIVYSSNRGGKYQVYEMNSNGENPRALAYGCVPFFSPDGTQIVFNQYCTDSGNIWVMNADGTDAKALTEEPYDNCKNPSWSPDGTKIVFQSEQSGNFEIWMMDADGTNWVQLTDDPAVDAVPVWHPRNR